MEPLRSDQQPPFQDITDTEHPYRPKTLSTISSIPLLTLSSRSVPLASPPGATTYRFHPLRTGTQHPRPHPRHHLLHPNSALLPLGTRAEWHYPCTTCGREGRLLCMGNLVHFYSGVGKIGVGGFCGRGVDESEVFAEPWQEADVAYRSWLGIV